MKKITTMMMKTKLFLLLLLLISMQSCKGKEKPVIDRGALILIEHDSLPNYTYKDYYFSPFYDYMSGYEMPFSLGEEWNVLYHKNTLGRSVIEKHTIVDTIRSGFTNAVKKERFLLPVFEDNSWDSNSPKDMYFLRGKFTERNDVASYRSSYSAIESNQIENKKQVRQYHRWTINGEEYTLQDLYLKKDKKGKYINELSYSNGSVKQILFETTLTEANLPDLNIELLNDLDGDGMHDFIYSIGYNIKNKDEDIECWAKSYVLFLSSEAEEGELLKHVATKTIVGEWGKIYHYNEEDNDDDDED